MSATHTPGPWTLCNHLVSVETDKSCPCGYRGGIYGSDGEHIVCEMGSTVISGQEGLEAPRYKRATEIANAHLIAAAPDLFKELNRVIVFIPHRIIEGNHYAPDCERCAAKAAIRKAKGEFV